VLVIALAAALEVRADQRVALRFCPGVVLPESCPSRSFLQVECAGCGLTRSFVHLAHGDFAASWSAHRLGWLLALAVVFQVPYRIVALRSENDTPLGRSFPGIVGWSLGLALIINWLIKLATDSIGRWT